jgi:hypothetical protein
MMTISFTFHLFLFRVCDCLFFKALSITLTFTYLLFFLNSGHLSFWLILSSWSWYGSCLCSSMYNIGNGIDVRLTLSDGWELVRLVNSYSGSTWSLLCLPMIFSLFSENMLVLDCWYTTGCTESWHGHESCSFVIAYFLLSFAGLMTWVHKYVLIASVHLLCSCSRSVVAFLCWLFFSFLSYSTLLVCFHSAKTDCLSSA